MNTASYTKIISSVQVVTQQHPIPGREADMAKNNAGGFSFKIDMWAMLDRFLILGSDKPTYYSSAKKLTLEAADNVLACIKADGLRTVSRITEISTLGRAPKNDAAIFALALCAINGNSETVSAAYAGVTKVCRIGTHLFQFVEAIDELGKWNAAAKRGISNWYLSKKEDRLALQMLKYQSRNGWAHRDVLRLAHVKPQSQLQSNLFRYVVKGAEGMQEGMEIPKLVIAYELLKRDPSEKNALKIIESTPEITWEMLPTELMRNTNVMSALIPNMGMTALIRKLGQLSNIGLLVPLSETSKIVMSKISNAEEIKRSRVHPVSILSAFNQYSKGAGDKGSLTWKPVQQVLDALNDAFYDSFNYIESTGRNNFVGVDCSGSMFGATVSGTSLTAAEVSAVMALATIKRESNYWIGGFDTSMSELKITPSMRIDNVLKVMENFRWGGTDCAQPMLYALKNKMNVDLFSIWTDNETWAGAVHPVEALRQYRKQFNEGAKLVVSGVTATNFSIADPHDAGMLDVVGFDSSVPQLIQSF